MKTDSSGVLIWDKSISAPQGTKVRIEKSGEIAIVSTKWFYSGGRDHLDVILIKTDKEGNEIFSKNYGGERSDQCFDFDLCPDGGYILAGQPRGYNPAWIHDESYGVRSTPDGGYIIAGGSGDEYSYSASGHPARRSDEWKAYMVKTDGEGKLLWEGIYPSTSVGNNAAEYVALTDDGGFIVFTDTDSESPPAPNNFGFMKIDPDTITESRYVELDITIEGEGDVYPRNRYHIKDSAITLTATPEKEWEFISWSGDVNSSENPISFTPGDKLSIQATFQSTVGLIETRLNSVIIYPNPLVST